MIATAPKLRQVRLARPSDQNAITRLKDEQNQRDGTCYPAPRLFADDGSPSPNIALALVMEEDGQVVQAAVFEKTVEMMLFGTDPKATARMRREIEFADYLLGEQGIASAHCLVPEALADQVEKPLTKAGFRRDQFVHFFHETVGSR